MQAGRFRNRNLEKGRRKARGLGENLPAEETWVKVSTRDDGGFS